MIFVFVTIWSLIGGYAAYKLGCLSGLTTSQQTMEELLDRKNAEIDKLEDALNALKKKNAERDPLPEGSYRDALPPPRCAKCGDECLRCRLERFVQEDAGQVPEERFRKGKRQ